MPTIIHPTAIVEPGAELADGVSIGAYAYIGSKVVLGERTTVHHHATVDGNTVMGEENEVHPYAFIGGQTQDLSYKGGDVGLTIGHRNIFREYTTVHGSTIPGTRTILGDDNAILAYSHIAHDCKVGNHLVMSSNAALAGHVEVGNWVNIAWSAGMHQHGKIGDYAMAAAIAKCTQDIPPFMIADGSPAQVRTINKVCLERRGFREPDIKLARRIFKAIYREGLNRSQAMAKLESFEEAQHPLVQLMLEFARKSKRGFA